MTTSLTSAALIPEARELTGRYDFLAELGRGGMGIVYLARDRTTARTVAIKLLGTLHAGDGEAARRFAREAETVAALDHPNIVRTLAIESLRGGAVAIVSEHIPGRTLRTLLRETGQLPFDQAVGVMRDVASALAYAHARRIVHRDVKPENIFVEAESGRALLADFGIARPLDVDTQLTAVGSSLGTPSYMAPEQVQGSPLDERADVYSLGLVGWEMLTGARPWEGETLYDVLHKQQHERLPSLAALRPDIPLYLLTAIEGALAKQPSERWANGQKLVEQLTPTPGALPVKRRADEEWMEAETVVVQQSPVAGHQPPVNHLESPVEAEVRRTHPLELPLVRNESPVVSVESPVVEQHEPRVVRPEPRVVEAVEPRVVEPAAPRVVEPATPRVAAPPPVEAKRNKKMSLKGPLLAGVAAAVAAMVFLGKGAGGGANGVLLPDAPVAVVTDTARSERASPKAAPRTSAPRVPAPAAARPPRVVDSAVADARPARTRDAAGTRADDGSDGTAADARCSTPTAAAQRACLIAEIDRNDADLTRTYQALIRQLRREADGVREPPAVVALRVEQRAWIDRRDRACRSTGTTGLWAAERAPCFARMSEERETVLRERLADR